MIGDCSGCGASLAADQRYCVSCGNKLAESVANPFAPPPAAPVAVERAGKKPLLPVRPQMASIYAASALGFGFVLGTGLSPNLTGINAAAPAGVTVPAPSAPSNSAPLASIGGGGGAPVSSGSTASGSSAGNTPSSGGGGGSQKNTKRKKQKQVQTATGTVVHVNPIAGSYAIAPASGGALVAIHAAQLPPPGAMIRVPVRILRNGTSAENGKLEKLGDAASATFSGAVTFRDPGAGVYTVSDRGVSLLVHIPLNATPTGSAPASAPPPLSASISVEVTINQPPAPDATPPIIPPTPPSYPNCPDANAAAPRVPPPAYLSQTSVTVTRQVGGPTDMAGAVRATCANPSLLVVSADDAGEAGKSILLSVPAGIDLTRLHIGQPLELSVAPADPGPYQLLGLTSDETISGADDPSTTQGTI